jgi:hypothetical protein
MRRSRTRDYVDSPLVGKTQAQITELETHLRSLPYDEYLATDYWRAVRKMVFETRGPFCEQCKDSQCRVDVHHLTYENRGREHRHLKDLRVLCDACHALAHRQQRALVNAVGHDLARNLLKKAI